MTEKGKLIAMSRLAVYEKKHGRADRRVTSFFRTDYIYRKNFMSRLCAFFGCVILLVFYFLNKIAVDQADLTTLDYRQLAFRAVVFVIVVMFAYTLITSIKSMREYDAASARQNKYYARLNRLNDTDTKQRTRG